MKATSVSTVSRRALTYAKEITDIARKLHSPIIGQIYVQVQILRQKFFSAKRKRVEMFMHDTGLLNSRGRRALVSKKIEKK